MTFTPPPPLPLNEYYCQMDGLTFTFRAYQLPDGSFEGKFTVFEGSADFNAIYFGDGTDDGQSPNLGGPLNMNGGSDTDWDQAFELSRPGLGKLGADKPTYLSEGESFTFALDIESLDEIEDIGVRATSTSTAEGSIKCELTPINQEHDDDHDHDEDHDEKDLDDDEDDGDARGQGAAAAGKGPGADDAAPEFADANEEIDDAEFYRQFAILIGELPEDAEVPEDDDEATEACLVL